MSRAVDELNVRQARAGSGKDEGAEVPMKSDQLGVSSSNDLVDTKCSAISALETV